MEPRRDSTVEARLEALLADENKGDPSSAARDVAAAVARAQGEEKSTGLDSPRTWTAWKDVQDFGEEEINHKLTLA